MSDPSIIGPVEGALSNPWVTGTGFLAGMAWIGTLMWQKLSGANLDVIRNRVETDIMAVLQSENIKERARADAERDRAEAAADERDIAVAKLSESDRRIVALTAEVHALREQVAALKTDVTWLKDHLEMCLRDPRGAATAAAEIVAATATAAATAVKDAAAAVAAKT